MSHRVNFIIEGHFIANAEMGSEADRVGAKGVEAHVRDRLVEIIGNDLDGLSFEVAAKVAVADDEVAS